MPVTLVRMMSVAALIAAHLPQMVKRNGRRRGCDMRLPPMRIG